MPNEAVGPGCEQSLESAPVVDVHQAPDDPRTLVRPLLGHLTAGVIAVCMSAVAGAVFTHPQGFLLGSLLVIVFFSLTSFVIAWAELVNRRLIFPLGVATYIAKVTAVGVIVVGLANTDWPGFDALVWGIGIGTAAWMVGMLAWAALRRHDQPDSP